MAFDVDRVREIAERVAASSGLEVVDIEFRGGGKSRLLRVFLDKCAAAGSDPLAGVTHEDCARFSREFGTIVDVEDAVPGASYTLEVSSPGFDRILRKRAHFERFVGERIFAELKLPINGRRRFAGVLKSIAGDSIVVEVDGQTHELPLERIQKARLRPE